MKLLFSIVLLAPLASAFPSFYVHQQQYRFDPLDHQCKVDKMCSFEQHDDGNGHAYSLNFIEVRDNGKLFEEDQLEAARNQIRAARADGQQPFVFIYVHGWHNNAGERTQPAKPNCSDPLYVGDVDKFRHCGLEVLASSIPTKPGLQHPESWAFNSLGRAPISDGFPSITFRVIRCAGDLPARSGSKVWRMRCNHSSTSSMSRDSYFVITMKHSFGARVLEAAVETVDPKHHPEAGIIQKYRSGQQTPSANAVLRRLPVDLVFYVNAATSHSISLKTVADWEERCREPCKPVGCDKNPLYIAVSSRADILTAVVMPIANLVFFSPLTDQYHLISMANTPWRQTHKIPKRVGQCPSDASPNAFCFEVPAASDYLEVDPKNGDRSAIFWAMNSDHWIAMLEGILHSIPLLRNMIKPTWVISTHGDVWNPGVFKMVQAVIVKKEIETREAVENAPKNLPPR